MTFKPHRCRFGKNGDYLKWFTGVRRKDRRVFPDLEPGMDNDSYAVAYYIANHLNFVGVNYGLRSTQTSV
jgi:hypothetical protein